MTTVERVEQKHKTGCQTAVCAMLSDDWTYDELAAEYGVPMSMRQIITALMEDGLHYNLLRASSVHEIADHAQFHDRLYVTIESPISERDPDFFHEYTAGQDSFALLHAVAIRGGEVLDPKPDPYFEDWHDLIETPYDISTVSMFTEREPRAIDFRPTV